VSDAIIEHMVYTVITLVIIAYLVRALDGSQ
jgi:hypothetical protein